MACRARVAASSSPAARYRSSASCSCSRRASPLLGDHRQEPEVVVGVGQQDRIAGRGGQLEPFLVGGPGGREVLHPVGQAALRGESGDADVDVVGRRAGEQLGQQGPGLADPAALLEPAPDPADDPQAQARLVVGERPVGRGAQVAVLPIEAPHVGLAGRAEDRAARRSRRSPTQTWTKRVSSCARSPLSASRSSAYSRRIGWRLKRVSTSSIAVPSGPFVPAAPISIRTRLLSASDSRPVSDVDAEIAVGIRDGPGGVGGPAAGEDGEPGEEPALFRGEQVVAPGDGAAQRPLALGLVARPAREVEAPAEPLEDRRRAHDPDAGRGELDRQREAVEALADRPDRGQRVLAEDEVGAVRTGAIDEQGDAGASTSSGGTGCPRSPPMRSSSRLVTSRHTFGRAARRGRRRRRRRPAGAARGCRGRGAPFDRGGGRGAHRRWLAPVTRARPRVAAIAASTSAGSRSAARSTNQTPCGKRSRTSRATASARRVLPLPPGPVRVTIRLSTRSARTASISSSRPTKLVTSPGRFEGTSSVRSGRASSATPGTTSR